MYTVDFNSVHRFSVSFNLHTLINSIVLQYVREETSKEKGSFLPKLCVMIIHRKRKTKRDFKCGNEPSGKFVNMVNDFTIYDNGQLLFHQRRRCTNSIQQHNREQRLSHIGFQVKRAHRSPIRRYTHDGRSVRK